MPADSENNEGLNSNRSDFILRMADWAINEAMIIDQPSNSFTRLTRRRSNRGERATFRTDAKYLGVTGGDVMPRLAEAAQRRFLSRNLQRKREKLARSVLVRLFTVPKKHNVR